MIATVGSRRCRELLLGPLLAVGIASPGTADELRDAEGVSGHVAWALRDVDVDGSQAKYEEDLDGLSSGVRLEDLLLEWHGAPEDAGLADHLRLTATGLGGDPEERVRFDLSRRDRYRLTLHYASRRYVYGLFGLVGDEDGHSWRSRSERNGLELRWHATPQADVVFGFDRHRRTGDRVFMKDVSRDVFLLDAPIDRETRSYSVGTDLELGDVRLSFRQTLRDHARRFLNRTEDDPGLDEADMTRLDSYDWLERDDSQAHLTTLRVLAPVHERVHVSFGYHGTLFGSEDFESRTRQDATGVDFAGMPLTIDGGFSEARIERDLRLWDAEVAVRATDEVIVRLGWRSLDVRDDGVLTQDLEGTGDVAQRHVRLDHSTDTLTLAVEARPTRRVGFRLGYRLADRALLREGYEGEREPDFRSDGDSSFLLGFTLRPADWVRFHADHEEADLDASFSELSPRDRSGTRARLTFTPRDGLDLGVTWRRTEHDNPLVSSHSDATEWSVSVRHRANQHVRWRLSWSRARLERAADVVFDGAAFGGSDATFPGGTLFDVEQDHLSGAVDVTLERGWTLAARCDLADVNGRELASGDDPNDPPVTPSEILRDQEWTDYELSVEKELASGVFLGLSWRRLDYDGAEAGLDHDARVLTLRAGLRF